MIRFSFTHCIPATDDVQRLFHLWQANNPALPFFNSRVRALVAALEYERTTPALNDGGSAASRFDLRDSLTTSMGVALIIPLLNSCFLAQPGSCPGIKQWTKS